MPHFGKRSTSFLAECHPLLQSLFNEVIKHYDCTIYEGKRGEEKQQEYFNSGLSKVRYPNSKHNTTPYSDAVHAAPWIAGVGIDWEDVARHRQFAHFVLGVAAHMSIKIRWGGDWDMDWETKDQTFHDLDHFELLR
jgi:peptidoglycan L-alanyl-D-glutamate endopeptidase CwlK